MTEAGAPSTHWEGEPVGVWRTMWGLPEFVALPTVSSTNAWLREHRPDAPDFTTVVAEEQTAGRGRGDASWKSPPGGLWFSVANRSHTPTADGLLPLRLGLAVSHAVGEVTGVPVRIKWPNDLWVGERKLGGILCEAGPRGLVLGIGLNLRSAPESPGLRIPAIALEEAAGARVSRAALLGAILREARQRIAAAAAVLSPDEQEELRSRDLLRGREIAVRPGPRGRAVGIDPRGRLMIETPTGVEHVYSGSIDFAGG